MDETDLIWTNYVGLHSTLSMVESFVDEMLDGSDGEKKVKE